MKPSLALLGFVLGSAASITFGLGGVTVVFLFLGSEYPRLQSEFPFLLASLGVFSALTALAAASFYGQLHAATWRRTAVAALLVGIGAAVWIYWP